MNRWIVCAAAAAALWSLQSPVAIAQPLIERSVGAEEFSAQSRRADRRRVPVYRTYPGPNSKRICNAYYEQEFRPSGTVIVPRMRCYWSG